MLNLQQRQSLQQKLSPQQIQYIKLLQLPTLALEQRIKAEMEINPVLEEGEEESELETSEDTEPTEADTPEQVEAEAEKEAEKEDDYDWEELLNNPEDLYGHKARVDRQEDEDRREMPMPSQSTMVEHLREQLSYQTLTDAEKLVAEQIIGSIDEDGYLRRPLESIIDDVMFNHGLTLSEEHVEGVLKKIQQLDPVGVGSRDLRECLLVQLESLPDDTPGLDAARLILSRAYKAFTMKHFANIMKRFDLSDEELKDAFDAISRLNPKPGEGAIISTQNYITPDFTVQFIDDQFIISLNGKNAPELRISRQYRQMLQQINADKKKGQKNSYSTDTRQFLKNKMESARWFINSINQRRQTMLKVMNAIVEIQEAFFRYGEGSLKPMILKDIAEKIHMDISTISRVVNGKYVQTDFGVYELKYYFSEGLSTESGEDVSNKEVKAIVERIISEEDKRKPLSDQKIATILEGKGFKIARRTVTKYREQQGIPVARMRKEIVLD